jgi:hypothetical protein
MTSEITSPFTVFFDRSGQPLDAGYIYIGLPGINPEVSPITVYWDSSLTTTAAQPIRTLAGYPSRDGSPGTIFSNQSSYSIVIRDRNGALVFSDLNATAGAATPETVADIAALRLLTASTTSAQVILLSNYVAGDGGGIFRYDSTDTTTADNGGTVIVDAAGKRWKRQYSDGFLCADWFGIMDNAADRTTALNSAIAASANATLILPAGTIRLDGQVVVNVSNITIQGAGRRATTLDLNNTATPAIEVGDQVSQKREIIFRDLLLEGMAGQDLIRTRWVRGIRFWSVNYSADCLLRLGEITDDLLKATYICELYDVEGAQVASPTKHHVIAANFQGQWVAEGAFVEGAYDPNLDGFHAEPNIQQRIDHFIVQGGYWSRFRDNYSFVDARVVNVQIDDSHHCENAYRNSIRLYVTSSTTKNVANVGWENVSLSGKYQSLLDNALFIRGERTGVSCTELSIIDAQFIGEIATPVLIQSDAGVIDTVMIDNLTVQITPTNASQDVVLISGGSGGATTISNVSVGQIAGVANTTALRSVVRVVGRVDNITPPTSIAVTNATIGFDDQTSATPVSLTNLTAATADIINVTDQSESWSRPMTLQNAADYFGTIGATGGFLESEIFLAGAVSLTTSTAADVTSITLTPGTWEVSANYALDPNVGTTSSAFAAWIHDVSATVPTRPNKGAYVQHAGLPYNVGPVGSRTFTVASNTPVYLGVFATFAVSTLKAYGYLSARRVYK